MADRQKISIVFNALLVLIHNGHKPKNYITQK
jgi:hypothetical protein